MTRRCMALRPQHITNDETDCLQATKRLVTITIMRVLCLDWKRSTRPLIAVVVAYAVAVQSLLLTLGGLAYALQASGTSPAFELCQHDAPGAPAQPAKPDNADYCSHCFFCLAGSHHAVIGNSFSVKPSLYICTPASIRCVVVQLRLPQPSHLIAIPRGPPAAA